MQHQFSVALFLPCKLHYPELQFGGLVAWYLDHTVCLPKVRGTDTEAPVNSIFPASPAPFRLLLPALCPDTPRWKLTIGFLKQQPNGSLSGPIRAVTYRPCQHHCSRQREVPTPGSGREMLRKEAAGVRMGLSAWNYRIVESLRLERY